MVRAIDKGDLYVHQGERSEWEQPAIGKASRNARVPAVTCPDGVSTMRATGGANWNVIALTDLGAYRCLGPARPAATAVLPAVELTSWLAT